MITSSNLRRLQENVQQIRQRVEQAAQRSGRRGSDITIVAVTKYVSATLTSLLPECGIFDLGESRPQTLWEKVGKLGAAPIRWHLIGHLQRNKIRRTLPMLDWLHSGDSLSLLEELNAEANRQGRTIKTLLEVNVSGEATKHGFSPDDFARVLPQVAKFEGLRVHGLMCMAARSGSLDEARSDFARLRAIAESATDCPPNVAMKELSMGMSGDYEVAIEEGATLVRIGSAFFEGMEDPT